MALSTAQHVEAAVEALQEEPFRYWVSGFLRTEMQRVTALVRKRLPVRRIEYVEFFPPDEQCLIYDVGRLDVTMSELKDIAHRRDTLVNRGMSDGELPT